MSGFPMDRDDLVSYGNQILQQALGSSPTNVAIDLTDFVNREYQRLCVSFGLTRKTVTYTLLTGNPGYITIADITTGITAYEAIVSVLYYDKNESFPLEHRDYRDVRMTQTLGSYQPGTPQAWGYDDTQTGKEFCYSPLLTVAQIAVRAPKLDISWVVYPTAMTATGSPDNSYPQHLQDIIAIQAACEALRSIEEYDKVDGDRGLQKSMLDPKLKLLATFVQEKYYDRSVQRFGKPQ